MAIKAIVYLALVVAGFVIGRQIEPYLGGYIAVFGSVIYIVWLIGTLSGGFEREEKHKNLR